MKNTNPASPKTPDRNQPEATKTACHQLSQNKNPFRQLDGDGKQPKPDRPKTADKNPTGNRTAKANRATCQKPQANNSPAMKETIKAYAGQKTYTGGEPPTPQLPQPTKPIRERQCQQPAEFRDDD